MNKALRKELEGLVEAVRSEICGECELTNMVFSAGADVADEFIIIRNLVGEDFCDDIIDDVRDMFENDEYLDVTDAIYAFMCFAHARLSKYILKRYIKGNEIASMYFLAAFFVRFDEEFQAEEDDIFTNRFDDDEYEPIENEGWN